MSPAALTEEIRGWGEALTDRGTLLALFLRVLVGALSAAAGIVVAGHAGLLLGVLAGTGASLVASLVALRAAGRP